MVCGGIETLSAYLIDGEYGLLLKANHHVKDMYLATLLFLLR